MTVTHKLQNLADRVVLCIIIQRFSHTGENPVKEILSYWGESSQRDSLILGRIQSKEFSHAGENPVKEILSYWGEFSQRDSLILGESSQRDSLILGESSQRDSLILGESSHTWNQNAVI